MKTKSNQELSRKQMRKQQRIQKKQKSKQYFQSLHSSYQQINTNAKLVTKKRKKNKEKKIIDKKNEGKVEQEIKQIIDENNYANEAQMQDPQDQEIKLLQRKLKIQGKQKGYNKIAMNLGYDDDLFDFLDNISKKVKTPINNQQQQLTRKPIEKRKKILKKQSKKPQIENNLVHEAIQQKKQIIKQNKDDEIILIRKGMNSLLNKLSDGNLAFIFKQLMIIFDQHSKNLTVSIFSQLFLKFNLIMERPIFHVFMTNVALASSLHHSIGNRLFGPLLHLLTLKFIQLENQFEDQKEVEQFGYSKLFEKKKNYILMICYFYDFGSITAQYVLSLVEHLASIVNEVHIQFLAIIIQKIGYKMRQNDPGALKQLLQSLKEFLTKYKSTKSGQLNSKVKFIELQINEIRFNRKSVFHLDEKMSFLYTFINKNVKNQYGSTDDVFLMTFLQVCKVDASRFNWWQGDNEEKQLNALEKHEDALLNPEKQKLNQLARKLQLATEARRNIFFILMECDDYIQATQKILENKIPNLQNVATVIVKVCISQDSYNPYYELVASKMASINPKFRLNIQYSIWDQLKQLNQCSLRQNSNLAKFLANIVANPLSDCSLSILKFFDDLSNLDEAENTFINIFFKEFFKKVSKNHLPKLISKLNEENNYHIKVNINQYLSDYQPSDKDSQLTHRICKKLLMIQKQRGQRD